MSDVPNLDLINSFFVLAAVAAALNDIRQLYADKCVEGFTFSTALLLTVWPLWDLCYYRGLGQRWSLVACLLLVGARSGWLVLAWHYEHPDSGGDHED